MTLEGELDRPASRRWKRCVVETDKTRGVVMREEATGRVLVAAKSVGSHFVLAATLEQLDRWDSTTLSLLLATTDRGSGVGHAHGEQPQVEHKHADKAATTSAAAAAAATGSPRTASVTSAHTLSLADGARTRVKEVLRRGSPFLAVLRSFPKQRQYRLLSTSCEWCDNVLGKFSCLGHSDARRLERQHLATISHASGTLACGMVARILVTDLPPAHTTGKRSGQRQVWCPRMKALEAACGGDGGGANHHHHGETAAGDGCGQRRPATAAVCRLVSNKPAWSDDFDALTLPYSGRRCLQPSGKNFVQQVRPSGRTALELGKMDTAKYAVDFRFPYSPMQAFATFLSTLSWLGAEA